MWSLREFKTTKAHSRIIAKWFLIPSLCDNHSFKTFILTLFRTHYTHSTDEEIEAQKG